MHRNITFNDWLKVDEEDVFTRGSKTKDEINDVTIGYHEHGDYASPFQYPYWSYLWQGRET